MEARPPTSPLYEDDSDISPTLPCPLEVIVPPSTYKSVNPSKWCGCCNCPLLVSRIITYFEVILSLTIGVSTIYFDSAWSTVPGNEVERIEKIQYWGIILSPLLFALTMRTIYNNSITETEKVASKLTVTVWIYANYLVFLVFLISLGLFIHTKGVVHPPRGIERLLIMVVALVFRIFFYYYMNFAVKHFSRQESASTASR